jgi:hypothetical protein
MHDFVYACIYTSFAHNFILFMNTYIGVEGTLFASLMSIYNAAGLVSQSFIFIYTYSHRYISNMCLQICIKANISIQPNILKAP